MSRRAMCETAEAETRETDDILTPHKAVCAMSASVPQHKHASDSPTTSAENVPLGSKYQADMYAGIRKYEENNKSHS